MTKISAFAPPCQSAVPGLIWPGLPHPRAQQILVLLQQFEQSQYWPSDFLRTQQFRQASTLLAHAVDSVPFYRDRLAAAGYRRDGALTADTWARIPLLRRTDIQTAGEALRSTALPAAHGRTYSVATSGSTGKPIVSLGTSLMQLFWDAFTLRDHLWHRRDFSGKLAAIRAFPTGEAVYPEGRSRRGWGRAVGSLYRSGPSAGLSIASKTEQQAEWLQRQQPDYLLTYPSALEALARHCRDHGISLDRLREVRTLSEVVSPRLRDLCREVWNVKLVDTYSAQEVGVIALQCPTGDHYHVQSEGVLVEVLDEDGRACPPGAIGRLVVTSLHNFAMPFIRYEIGDYAEVGGACACGRQLPVLRRVVGRVRNMMTLPDGGEAWPLIGDMFYRDIAPIRQFQIVQTSSTRLEMSIAAERSLTADEEGALRDVIRQRSGYSFEVVFRYVDEIPRGATGKYEEFKSEIVN